MSESANENKPLGVAPSPEAHQAVKGLVREVQKIITGAYGLKDIPDAAERVWNGNDNEMRSLLEKKGQRLLRHSALYKFLSPKGSVESLIHFSSSDMDMEKLMHSTPESRLRGEFLSEMTTLIEETSHYIYEEFYRRKYGQEAHRANAELTAVIDKYNILQALFRKNFGRTMNYIERSLVFNRIASVAGRINWIGNRPAAYIVGHELGKKYIDFLDNCYKQGKNASQELLKFYHMSNKEQIEHLFELGFTVNTRTPGENASVQEVFKKIGVNPHHKPLSSS